MMIVDPQIKSQIPNWKKDMQSSIGSVAALLDYCAIDPLELSDLNIDPEFPIRVTRHYANLIEKGNALDPLLLQVLPHIGENQTLSDYYSDPVGDMSAMTIPGLIHKYQGRVLLTTTGACAIHCRYCFRQHFPYADAQLDFGINGKVYAYLQQHSDVSEVILSGGDPLMLGDHKISDIVVMLNRLKHVTTLRIHTRLLTSLPSRLTNALIEILQEFNGQVVVVSHCNHANEIDTIAAAAIAKLRAAGFHLFNQSVLLRHINDNATTLALLSKRLFEHGILPYYLHCLDHVLGSQRFEVAEENVLGIHSRLSALLPGYLVPRLVREIAGDAYKRPVSGPGLSYY